MRYSFRRPPPHRRQPERPPTTKDGGQVFPKKRPQSASSLENRPEATRWTPSRSEKDRDIITRHRPRQTFPSSHLVPTHPFFDGRSFHSFPGSPQREEALRDRIYHRHTRLLSRRRGSDFETTRPFSDSFPFFPDSSRLQVSSCLQSVALAILASEDRQSKTEEEEGERAR